MSKYKSPFSVDYRTPVEIDSNDPRAKKGSFEKTYARYGRDINIVTNPKPVNLQKSAPFYFGSNDPTVSIYGSISSASAVNDLADNTYISGGLSTEYVDGNTTKTGFHISKYNKSGKTQWNKALEPSYVSQTSGSFGGSVKDSEDNIYILANYHLDNLEKNLIAIIAKYDSSGNLQWNKHLRFDEIQYGNDINTSLVGNSISIDSNDNIYISGEFTYNGEDSRMLFIIKYDIDGNIQWQKFLAQNRFNFIGSIKIDSLLNIYMVGYYRNEESGNILGSVYILKINSDGDLIWQKKLFSPNANFLVSSAYQIEIDRLNNIYICGYFQTVSPFSRKLFLVKLNSLGTIIKQKQLTGWTEFDTEATSIFIYSIKVSFSGDIYISISSREAYIAKIDSSFNLKQLRCLRHFSSYGSSDQYNMHVNNISFDSSENLIICGALNSVFTYYSLNAKIPSSQQGFGIYTLDFKEEYPEKTIAYFDALNSTSVDPFLHYINNIKISNPLFSIGNSAFVVIDSNLYDEESDMVEKTVQFDYNLINMAE